MLLWNVGVPNTFISSDNVKNGVNSGVIFLYQVIQAHT